MSDGEDGYLEFDSSVEYQFNMGVPDEPIWMHNIFDEDFWIYCPDDEAMMLRVKRLVEHIRELRTMLWAVSEDPNYGTHSTQVTELLFRQEPPKID